MHLSIAGLYIYSYHLAACQEDRHLDKCKLLCILVRWLIIHACGYYWGKQSFVVGIVGASTAGYITLDLRRVGVQPLVINAVWVLKTSIIYAADVGIMGRMY